MHQDARAINANKLHLSRPACGFPIRSDSGLNERCLPQRLCQYGLGIPNCWLRMQAVETWWSKRAAISVSRLCTLFNERWKRAAIFASGNAPSICSPSESNAAFAARPAGSSCGGVSGARRTGRALCVGPPPHPA